MILILIGNLPYWFPHFLLISTDNFCLPCSRGKQLVWNSDSLSLGSCHQPRFSLLKNYQRIKTGTKLSAIVVVVLMFSIYNFFVGRNNVIGRKAMPVENPSLIGQALVNQKCVFCVLTKV